MCYEVEHTAQLIRKVFEKMHWKILPHSPYTPNLFHLCHFHFLRSLNEALGRFKIQNDDDVGDFVREWLCGLKTRIKNFFHIILTDEIR